MADFVSKTLTETTKAIEYAVFANRYSEKKGFLQAMDPRVKLISFLGLLILIGLTRRLDILAAFYIGSLILALISHVPLGFFLKRVWLFIPLFTGLVILPSIFNIVTPGKPVYTLFSFAASHQAGPFFIPQQISITEPGLFGASVLIMRVAASVSLAILLVMTTPWIRLLKALYVLKMPEIIILTLAMTYRYIYLFLKTVEGMLLAKKSREISDLKLAQEHGWIASRMGVLVGKSYRLSNDVHMAMRARGWDGNPRMMDDFRFRRIDGIWAGICMVVFALWALFRWYYG